MQKHKLFGHFLLWRIRHLKDAYFLIILSVFVGVLAGFAAYLLKNLVYFLQHQLTHQLQIAGINILYVFFPLIGVLLTLLFLHLLVRDKVRHGIPRILFVIGKLGGNMRKHKVFSSLVGGGLTAGFGGSVGLESPIISAGSSLGSTMGQLFRLNYPNRVLLIGCGAAGAIASIFTTPVAAVVFSLEVLLLDLSTTSIIPLLVASVSGAITTKLLLSERYLLIMEDIAPFSINQIPFYMALGILVALLSLYFTRVNNWVRHRMEPIKNIYLKALYGTLFIGLALFLFPSLYGEGYDSIRFIMRENHTQILANSLFVGFADHYWVVGLFLLFVMLLKAWVTAFTIESGGVGGIFAPVAFTGGLAGFLFVYLLKWFFPELPVDARSFTLVGMAGLLTGVMHAPLTAIFLIMELTRSYELIVPLMLTATIAFITVKIYAPHPLFISQLAERGDLFTRDKDRTVLTLLQVRQVIDRDLLTIHPDKTLGDLIPMISRSKRNIFPVVMEDKTYLGVVVLDDVREDMFESSQYHVPIRNYMIQAPEQVGLHESMEQVMEKFTRTGYYNLPVIENGKYIGFVSRANIFSAYRKILKKVSAN